MRGDTVLEVGPGKGVLTKALLERAGKVIAVEKDKELKLFLEKTFQEEIKKGTLILVSGDILDVKKMMPEQKFSLQEKYKVVANIPYYITGEFLRAFLSGDFQPESMTVLLQKEVAERIVARDGKESILSISVKAYGVPVYVQTVLAREFSPPPKVDSAILHIAGISKAFFKEVDEKIFFSLVKTGFAHKRKMLIGNLKQATSPEKLKKAFETCGISQTARAETLSLGEWKCLAGEIS